VLIRQNLLNASDLAAVQADFDSAGMIGGRCQDILDNPGGAFAGSLIRLQYDFNGCAGTNIFSVLSIH
jgi:hypothetical protein